jgi:hypothetical protein
MATLIDHALAKNWRRGKEVALGRLRETGRMIGRLVAWTWTWAGWVAGMGEMAFRGRLVMGDE